jgi:Holliday junction resolvase
MYADENEMKNELVKWLEEKGFIVGKGIHIGKLELDIIAVGNLLITKSGIKQAENNLVYIFETKIATTHKLMRNVVEQAILRLLMADYVYIVIPKKAEVWENEKTRKIIEPPKEIQKFVQGYYSINIGILTMELGNLVEVIRPAQRSELAFQELKNKIIQKVRGSRLL